MRLMVNAITVLLFYFPQNVMGQNTVTGLVTDAVSNQGLSYVNIGIPGRDAGTVSSETGSFSIVVSDIHHDDTLRFSMIGYKSLSLPISGLIKQYDNQVKIALEPAVYPLREVTISNHQWKNKKRNLGNRNSASTMMAGFSTNDLGSEVGVAVKVRNKPVIIQDFSFPVAKNRYDSLFFRLNIYQIHNGKVGEPLHDENIFVQTQVKKGWVTVDLSDYRIIAHDDFLVALEWVRELGKPNEAGLLFNAGLYSPGMYYRKTSQGSWEKMTLVAVGFMVTVME
jgi:hypothetical protein